MPFTLSHPAAVLPLARGPLVPSALVIGAMAPDLPYFFYLAGLRETTHSMLGVVTVDVVIGLAAFAVFHLVWKRPLAALTPAVARTRLRLDGTAGGSRRIALRYLLSPERITGDGVTFARNGLADGKAVPTGETEHVEAGPVLSSIGYRGEPVPGLPFDGSTGTVPHEAGRVTGAVSGAYVTGWTKRGPTGFIGTNKTCARETVRTLIDDFNGHRLPEPAAPDDGLARLLESRGAVPEPV